MCGCKAKDQGCQKPENLKGKPQECSAAQVKTCHGDARTHVCATGKGAQKGCQA